MTERQLEQHVTILGWLHIVANAVFLLIGVFVFFLLATLGFVSGEREAMAILPIIGIFVGLVMACLGLPGIVAGVGLLKRKNWGRILAVIVGALGLLNFPFGTALGIYTLWVMMQDAATDYFAPVKMAG